MNNNERLNNTRLVLKRQKETVYYQNIRLKRRKQDPRSQSPLSPKKRKSKTLEISSKSTRKLAVATRIKRDSAFRDIQHYRFSQQNTFSSEKRFKTTVRVCVLFATKFLIFRGRESEMKMILITHARVREKERLLLSLPATKAHRIYNAGSSHKAREHKKNVRNVPLYLRRLNLLFV